ncbi:hypothetical protein KOW79_016313 [Hemibagrus wyckioides]|uniref:Uncharacterized protein n=1 Tax=Hemibagrus wyckioides TaxID=337641 RepID=A0A9D3NG85_9TELE|nr:hypothetical protein KOW79_016313 [Hemibagrus wyckioides]
MLPAVAHAPPLSTPPSLFKRTNVSSTVEEFRLHSERGKKERILKTSLHLFLRGAINQADQKQKARSSKSFSGRIFILGTSPESLPV